MYIIDGELVDIIMAIDELNHMIYDYMTVSDCEELDTSFSLNTDCCTHKVSFEGQVIWSSNDDDRFFYEDKNEYETFDDCFKRKAIDAICYSRNVLEALAAGEKGQHD